MTSLAVAFPAVVAITGKILTVQKDINAFTMIVRQRTGPSFSSTRLQIRCLMCLGSTGDTCLPAQNDIVNFSGIVSTVNNSVLVVIAHHVSVLHLSDNVAPDL